MRLLASNAGQCSNVETTWIGCITLRNRPHDEIGPHLDAPELSVNVSLDGRRGIVDLALAVGIDARTYKPKDQSLSYLRSHL